MSDLKPGCKRIAIFLDGTWNTLWDNTNVWRLKSLCIQNDKQVVYYSKGVGTQIGKKIIGGALGYGIDQEVIDAYEWLIENYNEDDRSYLFGFSRGAYTARSLSGLIAKCGLLRPGAPLSVKQLYDRYQKGGKGNEATPRTMLALKRAQENDGLGQLEPEERRMLKYCHIVPIRFLGVWDTVGSLGISFSGIPKISSESYQFLETDLRISNYKAYHALAIDEHREKFAPTLWTKPKESAYPDRKIEDVEQRWFVGAHANVGGGYPGDLLAQRPLQWLMSKAIKDGLEFREKSDIDVEIDGYISSAEIKDSYAEFLGGIYKFLPFSKRYYRAIGGLPLVTKESEESETINETIDWSVFDRWHNNESYRPQNISDWADNHGVTIDSLITKDQPQNAVNAKFPNLVVPD
jgi:uncharacterized protein (DUF2235 family)